MMSPDKLKHQVSQQFLSRDMTLMSHWRIHCSLTAKQVKSVHFILAQSETSIEFRPLSF